ncbi:hypothetical protein Ahy_B03g068244 [Arachis hypogaea]|uniref:Uncharacterized protein n=1 Tax=Arachis hypogaea TaxID=3818 RepID=A0A445A928_ARAHY|nr:hypothetical protein Ahy_B03g068244 [Arachis hypogaea]
MDVKSVPPICARYPLPVFGGFVQFQTKYVMDEANVAEVANALANPHPFQEPSFMRSLDLEAMHAPEFPQYMNPAPPVVADGEFTVGMEFSSREAVIKAIKDYTIRIGVDYWVYESESTTFYAKCTEYGMVVTG